MNSYLKAIGLFLGGVLLCACGRNQDGSSSETTTPVRSEERRVGKECRL